MSEDFTLNPVKLIQHMLHDVAGTMTLSALGQRFRDDLDGMLDALKELQAQGKLEFVELTNGRVGVRWKHPIKQERIRYINRKPTPNAVPAEKLKKAFELKKMKWGCARIAHHLGVAPSTLYYAMKEYQ